jgi:hypothetical protein
VAWQWPTAAVAVAAAGSGSSAAAVDIAYITLLHWQVLLSSVGYW